jgi:hypothetical protein
MPHDQQAIQQTKGDRRHDEQIHRRDAVGMIAEEGLPALGRRAPSPGHILGDAGLADLDAQLAMDPRRSPQRIGEAHLADQPSYFGRNRRSAGTRS